MNKPYAHIYSAEVNKWIAGTSKLPTYLRPRSPHGANVLVTCKKCLQIGMWWSQLRSQLRFRFCISILYCHLSADSQPKSVGFVCGLAATRRSVCIHQMNQVNSCSDHGHEDSTINIVVELLLLLLILMEWRPAGWSVCLPLLIYPCTIKSRSSLLAPAHLGDPGKRAVKWLWWWYY